MDIGGIVFHLSPLSWNQKQDILNETTLHEGEPTNRNSTYKCIKYAVKKIDGVTLSDGTAYAVEIEDGVLSDSSVEDILNLELSPTLIMACYSLIHGVPTEVRNPVTGEKVEGVSIVKSDSKKK